MRTRFFTILRCFGPKRFAVSKEDLSTPKCRHFPVILSFFVLAGLAAVASIPTALVAQLSTPGSAVSESFSFTAINFPGANRTRALGINNHGDIVGDYQDSSGVFHGYLLSGGNFTAFDPPGSLLTRGLAVNDRGVIGGRFIDSNIVQHGYLLDQGVFTILTCPVSPSRCCKG